MNGFPIGHYSRGAWTVFNTQNDTIGVLAKVASSHENAHRDLNSSNSYGMLIEIYAKLAQESKQDSHRYKYIFETLVEHSRNAHELFATWLSLKQFTHGDNGMTLAMLVGSDTNLIERYNRGEYITARIPSFFLKIVVFQTVLYFCFQSGAIADSAFKDVTGFNPGSVNAKEYPDARLRRIIRDFSPDFYLNILNDFMKGYDGSPAFDYFRKNIVGEPVPPPGTVENILGITRDFMNRYYEVFQKHFDSDGFYSVGLEDHLSFFTDDVIKEICSLTDEAPETLLLYKDENTDRNRTILIGYEAERTIINNQPLDCNLHFYPDIPNRFRQYRFEKDETLILNARHSIVLREQFHFKEQDKQWIDNFEGLVVYVPFITQQEDTKIVDIVVFDQPDRLLDFLAELYLANGVFSTLGCLFYSALTLEDTETIWTNVLERCCHKVIAVNDISLLFLVETHFFKEHETITYQREEVSIEGKLVNLFIAKSSLGETSMLIITVAGALFLSLMERYIENNFLHLQNDNRLFEENRLEIEEIIRKNHLTEHIWYFRTQALPENFYRNKSTAV